MAYTTQHKHGKELNRPYEEDLPVHDWYRFVLSFPPHLVRNYIEKFALSNDDVLLDPFCGTGTTVVEAKKLGIPNVGIEANPMAHFAASVKTQWDVDPSGLMRYAKMIAENVDIGVDENALEYGPLFGHTREGEVRLRSLPSEQFRLLIKDAISPLPLHKVLTLIDTMKQASDVRFENHAKLALAKQAVYSFSNLRFGPEIGVGKIKLDVPVIRPWFEAVQKMANDLDLVKGRPDVRTCLYQGDARTLSSQLAPASVNAVITSPPYPNEKDYSRTTRLESVLLGFVTSRQELRKLKQQFIRSNTRGVYKADTDGKWVSEIRRVESLAQSIEERRKELGKTSGFEKQYAQVVRLYFGGMARHLAELRSILRPQAKLAYVVGDQASYFRVMIRTGEILAEIAHGLGYRVVDIELFRQRISTATKQQLREEVVLLEWNG